jgi:peptidoglycan/LPS O-acetylase OafA/YrhL
VHYAYSAIAGFNHSAVIVFFVLSGFLVGGSFYGEVAHDRENIKVYLIKRLVRLWIVLLPALALTWVCLKLSFILSPGYSQIPSSHNELVHTAGFGTFLCNAVFLQNVGCLWYGGNLPLWSLNHEFWYYMTFPFMCVAFFSHRRTPMARLASGGIGVAAILAVTYFQFNMYPIAPYMVMWLLGVAASLAPPRPISVPVAAGLFLFTLVGARMGNGHVLPGVEFSGWTIDAAVAASFAYLIFTLKHEKKLTAPTGGHLHRTVAGFSFSLYCIHEPILTLYGLTLQRFTGLGINMVPAGITEWSILVIGLIITLILAWGFSRLTEAHTDGVRRWIVDMLHVAPGRRKLASSTRRWISGR